MSAPLPPAVAALERRLRLDEGSLVGPDRAAAEDALADATALVLAEVPPGVGEAWRTDAPAAVTAVVLKAARREYENPQGVRSETLGEHSTEVAIASGVFLAPREVAAVRRAVTGRPGGFVGTVRTPSAYSTDLD